MDPQKKTECGDSTILDGSEWVETYGALDDQASASRN